MRSVICGIAALLLVGIVHPGDLVAQRRGIRRVQPMPRIELTPYAGWQWGGGIVTTLGDLRIRGAMNWGGILGIRTSPMQVVELTYNYQQAPLVLERGPLGGGDSTWFDLRSHFIQLGGRVERESGPVTPFVVGGLGITIFDPAESGHRSETRFSVHFGGGLRVPFSERLALRAQLRGWYSFLSTSGGVFCGPGGCSFGVSGSGIFQGDVSGGLTIGF